VIDLPQDEASAIAMQEKMRTAISLHDELPSFVRLVGGVDVAYAKQSNLLVAAVAVLDANTLNLLEVATFCGEAQFPYIPGLFSFRELPPILAAMDKLSSYPDLVICDGHGYAHPRRFGLACHFGVETGIPSIGCAKTHLCGEYALPGNEKGSHADLVEKGEIIGKVLRTQHDTRPMYVSAGHKISLPTACTWVMHLCREYRLPETTRAADHAVKMALKELGE
jgi:deoxyribonuclease V